MMSGGEVFMTQELADKTCVPCRGGVPPLKGKELEALHGDGGLIAITPDGQLAWSFNTPGMYRAKLSEGGKLQIGVYNDEP